MEKEEGKGSRGRRRLRKRRRKGGVEEKGKEEA